MKFRSIFAVAALSALISLSTSIKANAQGCTAARGCPTLPPSLPRASSQGFSLDDAILSSNVIRPSRPADNQSKPGKAGTALIRVTAPVDDATITFQGTPTSQKGTTRAFRSPALAPGRDYVYTIRCTWTVNGQRFTRQQRVQVNADQETSVAFGPTPSTPAPRDEGART